LIAYCCQFYINITDAYSLQHITSLNFHKFTTTAVKWCPDSSCYGSIRGNSCILASGDENGIIIIQNAKTGKKLASLENGKFGIVQLFWYNDRSKYLIALDSGSNITLWKVRESTKVFFNNV
jgi:hypothetical protein